MASRRIVVATASRHGATAEIGERIARVHDDDRDDHRDDGTDGNRQPQGGQVMGADRRSAPTAL